MRKLYTVLFLFSFFFFYRAGAQVASFSFAGSDGDEMSWASSFNANGVQSCVITRGPGVTAIANADRFNSKGWTMGNTPDMDDYIQFVITPKPGFSLSLSTINLQHQRSVTGPKSFVIRTSLNDFSQDATNVVDIEDVNSNQVSSFGFPAPITITSPLIIRLYAYNAEAMNGTWGPGESVDGNDLTVMGSFLILPVKFVNLGAAWMSKQVEISWGNATESDLLYYVVERSANGQNFTELTKVMPAKNDGGMASYKSYDWQPLAAANYYRIKAVEASGHVLYSYVVKIENQTSKTSLALYPNPVQQGSQMMLQMNGLPEGKYSIVIYNALAQAVHQQTITLSNGAVTQPLSLQRWQRGTYVVKISGAVELQQRFIVQ